MSGSSRVCRCQHVRGRHAGGVGRCKTCGTCESFVSALYVWDVEIPPGVEILREYEHSDYTRVRCTHDPEFRVTRPQGFDACSLCRADEFATSNFVRPVQMLAYISRTARAVSAQGELF
jgi:hypothetical protein